MEPLDSATNLYNKNLKIFGGTPEDARRPDLNYRFGYRKNISKISRLKKQTFRSFRSLEHFSNFRSRRRDRFGPKIIKFRAILAIFRLFEDSEFETAPKRCI